MDRIKIYKVSINKKKKKKNSLVQYLWRNFNKIILTDLEFKTVFFKVEDLCSDVHIYLIECNLWILFLFFYIYIFFKWNHFFEVLSRKVQGKVFFFYKSSSFLKSVKILMVDSRLPLKLPRIKEKVSKFYSFFPFQYFCIVHDRKKKRRRKKKIGRYLYINCILSLEIKLFSFKSCAML